MTVATIRLRARPITNQSSERRIWPPSSGYTGRMLKTSRTMLIPRTVRMNWKASGIVFAQPRERVTMKAREENRHERHIHQRAGHDTPQRSAGPLRRVHIRHSTQRPQHDPICRSPYLAASQRVPELMQQHNGKQRQVLQRIPDQRVVSAFAAADFDDGHHKP